MTKNTLYTEVENFVSGPEFIWFESCMKLIDEIPNEHLTYESLLDGVLIHRLMCMMRIRVKEDEQIEFPNGDTSIRRHNLRIIFNNIKCYYEEEMEFIIMKAPNINNLIKNPEENTEEIVCLLNLLIGCAQLCPERERFSESFRILRNNSDKIIHVSNFMTTQLAVYVFDSKMLKSDDTYLRESNADRIYEYIRHLHRERDTFKKLTRKRRTLPTFDSYHIDDDDDHDNDEEFEISLSYVYRALDYSSVNNCSLDSTLVSELSQMKEREKEWLLKNNYLNSRLRCATLEINDLNYQIRELKNINWHLEIKVQQVQYYRDLADVLSEENIRVNELESCNKNLIERIEKLSVYKKLVESLQPNTNEAEPDVQDLIKTVKKTNETNKHLVSENKELKERLEKILRSSSEIVKENMNDQTVERNEDRVESNDENMTDNKNQDTLDEIMEHDSWFNILKIKKEIQRLENICDNIFKDNTSDSVDTNNIDRNNSELCCIINQMKKCTPYLLWCGKEYESLPSSNNVSEQWKDESNTNIRQLYVKVHKLHKQIQDLSNQVQITKDQYNDVTTKSAALINELECVQTEIINQKARIGEQKLYRSYLKNKKSKLESMRKGLEKICGAREKLLKDSRLIERQYYQLEQLRREKSYELHESEKTLVDLKNGTRELGTRCEGLYKVQLQLVKEKMKFLAANKALRCQNQKEAEKWIRKFQNHSKTLLKSKERLEKIIVGDSFEGTILQTSTPNTNKRKGIRQLVNRIRDRSADLFLKKHSRSNVDYDDQSTVEREELLGNSNSNVNVSSNDSEITPLLVDNDNHRSSDDQL